ncbi:MAG: hypothetical protein UX09_C0015G0010 [Candidatus Uhrbacteria bacterium GW2011_GWE2_45_35]|uniref:Caib/baif family protein n=2 Tax=Candidatus Uhriibacteriota TaxID=1752732 RepID=A0A0G1MFL6_9BACT|nr:MAG: hypothetical protein UW63_C0022G0005 [Candidatus Uhrbacteria bacterium GW2011_GWF2_44_350]KKU08623.1 MAG: hypothetical protein UX09_C0015G0010 [Candidatus Uhrbacteria bacterium GW2011_GWE2_45_35]HBR80908.1 hypothetical protein [Candidatus Uhrbacteria bacterium]HCU31224.1 hypothetical protein [Candidatus Uhrbacteria bacterium]
MSHTPQYDVAVAKILAELKPGERVCALTGKIWNLTQKEIDICRDFKVPPTTVAPDVLMNYLNGFNTGFAAFWKAHVKTGQPILSAIHPDSPFPVVSDKEFYELDNTEYGQEPDSQRSVLEQLFEIQTKTPIDATRNSGIENSTAVVASINVLNSHAVFGSFQVKNSFYVSTLGGGEDDIDASGSDKIFQSHSVSASVEIFNGFFIICSSACRDSSFLFDCQDCEFCFGGTNLRHKKFVFFNQQLSEAEYREKIKDIDLSQAEVFEKYKADFFCLWREQGIWPENFNINSPESSGDRLINCLRCENGYLLIKSSDCFNTRFAIEAETNVYCSGNAKASRAYMCTGGSFSADSKFCQASPRIINCEYCINCVECENCFACVNLFRKKFCVLNKQYTEEEYWSLVDKLKCKMLEDGEYGRFFPAKTSPCGFQFSGGEIYRGFSEAELELFQVPRLDPARGQLLSPAPNSQLTVADIPNHLDEADKIVNQPIFDPEINRLYSITKPELEIYKNKKWPLPRQHFITRLKNLIRFSNSPEAMKYNCDFCKKDIVTYKNFTFSERKVFCQECYLKHLEENN